MKNSTIITDTDRIRISICKNVRIRIVHCGYRSDTDSKKIAIRAPLKNITDEFMHIVEDGVSNGMNLRVLLLFDVALCRKQI